MEGAQTHLKWESHALLVRPWTHSHLSYQVSISLPGVGGGVAPGTLHGWGQDSSCLTSKSVYATGCPLLTICLLLITS